MPARSIMPGPWGYSYGAAAEWYQGRLRCAAACSTCRLLPAGGGDNARRTVSIRPSSQSWSAKSRSRTSCGGSPASSRSPAFVNRGNVGSFQDAVALSQRPAVLRRRHRRTCGGAHYYSRPGVSANLEQQITETIWRVLARRLGRRQRSSLGFRRHRPHRPAAPDQRQAWGRPDDKIGVAGVIDGLRRRHVAYFAAGGLGILIGDGALDLRPREDPRDLLLLRPHTWSSVTFDYQFVADPAYNAARGPVNIFAGRLHAEF